jgi:hypothetical protein
VGTTLGAEFQVFGDLPAQQSFEVQSGKLMVIKASSVVTADSYPKSF